MARTDLAPQGWVDCGMVGDLVPNRRLIVILRGIPASDAAEVAQALVNCGRSMIEVPLNSPDPYLSIANMIRQFGGRAQVGAWTVLMARQGAEAGGQPIVSPNCNPDVIRTAVLLELASWQGVMTPTEHAAALDAGSSGLKLFLVGVVGMGGYRQCAPCFRKRPKCMLSEVQYPRHPSTGCRQVRQGLVKGLLYMPRTYPFPKSSPAQVDCSGV